MEKWKNGVYVYVSGEITHLDRQADRFSNPPK